MLYDYHIDRLPSIETAMLAAFEAGAPRVVLGLDSLDHLESNDVRGLIILLRRARDVGGEIALSVTRPDILRSLNVMALDRLFPIVSPKAAA